MALTEASTAAPDTPGEELIDLAKRGDRDAFAHLYETTPTRRRQRCPKSPTTPPAMPSAHCMA
jgi:hypothetical protein